VFGHLIHRQTNTQLPWDESNTPEASAVVEDDSFVGFDAQVIGGVKLGPRAYICAGALVTRDVPADHVRTA